MSFFESNHFVYAAFGAAIIALLAAVLWKTVHWAPRGITHRAKKTTENAKTEAGRSGTEKISAWTFAKYAAWVVGIGILGFVLWRSGFVSIMLNNPEPSEAKAWMRQNWLFIPILLAVTYVIARLPGLEKWGKLIQNSVYAIVGVLLFVLVFAWFTTPSTPSHSQTSVSSQSSCVFTPQARSCSFGRDIVWVDTRGSGRALCVTPLPTTGDYIVWYIPEGSAQPRMWFPGAGGRVTSYGFQSLSGSRRVWLQTAPTDAQCP